VLQLQLKRVYFGLDVVHVDQLVRQGVLHGHSLAPCDLL